MQQRGPIYLALAAVLFGVAFFIAKDWMKRQQPEALATTPVVVARLDLQTGIALAERELEVVDWPQTHSPAGALTSIGAANGRVLRRPMAAGEPILESALHPQGTAAGLPAVISEKARAITVKVDAVIGVAGFVRPGSNVDVFATLRKVDDTKPLPYSKLILQDVRVLAIDQKLEEVKNGDAQLVSVVTLEVTPEQAEKLVFAAHEGKLQLALRNAADNEIVKTQAAGVSDVLGQTKTVKRAGPACPCGSYSVEVVEGDQIKRRGFCKSCPLSETPEHSAKEEAAQSPESLS